MNAIATLKISYFKFPAEYSNTYIYAILYF